MAQAREDIIERPADTAASRCIPIAHVGEGRHRVHGDSAGIRFDLGERRSGPLVSRWAGSTRRPRAWRVTWGRKTLAQAVEDAKVAG